MAMRPDHGAIASDDDPEDSFNDTVLDDSWFYGPPKKKQALNNVTNENVITSTSINVRQASLVEKSFGDMETFPKQRLAMAKLQESAKVFKNARLFSFEVPSQTNGERRYLVSTLERFWSWYDTLKDRHLYEIITESTPCRLYFDLEYCKNANPNIDHEAVYNYFMDAVKRLLYDEFELDVNPAKEFLVLDSSTENKFSAHVICHLPNGYLFPSNLHIRPFCSRLSEIVLENSPVKIWNADRTKETTLFDSAVYTKNRNFRLFSSSKLGKNTRLKLAEYCAFYGSRTPSDRQVFYDSICIPANALEFPLLKVRDSIGNEMQRFHGVQYSATSSSVKVGEGSGPSPYIQLDEFMLMVWRKWNPLAYIRQWRTASDSSEGRITSITYYPANCRYCFNIGREHKSNGTFWIVNLVRNDFNQRCFDPECRGTSSNFFPLPSFIVDSLQKRESKYSSAEENGGESFFDEDDVASFFDESCAELSKWFIQWEEVFEQ